MNLLSAEELRGLVASHEQPCVSIYIPTIRAGDEIQQNPIRFKNLIRQAEKELAEAGMRPTAAKGLLEPLYDLLNNEIFWQYQSDGLAVFVSGDNARHYRLPLHFTERVIVSDAFFLKPLLPLFVNNGHFYLLALSQQAVRLFSGTRFSMDEIDLEDTPQSLAEALKWDDPEPQLQHHASEGPSTGGEKAAMFHGHGAGEDDQKNDILRFFQAINKGMKELLADESAPLILGGVEYLLPIYREANSYNQLLEEGITGNLEELQADELHRRAWSLVEPLFQKEQSESLQFFVHQKQLGRTSEDLSEIVPASVYGQVDRLFVVMDEVQWGSFDPDTSTVALLTEAGPGSSDLLDLAASHAFLNGGKVFAVGRAEMPADTNAAAVLRWAGSPAEEQA